MFLGMSKLRCFMMSDEEFVDEELEDEDDEDEELDFAEE
jgi:hypothetical protein